MSCKCQYYLMNDEGLRVCSVCGKPSPTQPWIEDKMVGRQQTKKAPLYISDEDKAKAEAKAKEEAEAEASGEA